MRALLVPILSGMALSACTHSLPTDRGLPPVVRLSHEGEVVSHSNPQEREARTVACGYGSERRGDIFPVQAGFPAIVEAEFVDRWGLGSAKVTVFGGSFMDLPSAWEARSTVVDGQYAETASRGFKGLGFGLGPRKVRFAVMPVAGSREGQSTIKLEASAEDRKGRIGRTTTPLMASPAVLCGSY
jgi:hypothetical protein